MKKLKSLAKTTDVTFKRGARAQAPAEKKDPEQKKLPGKKKPPTLTLKQAGAKTVTGKLSPKDAEMKKLPGKKTPPTAILKRGNNNSIS